MRTIIILCLLIISGCNSGSPTNDSTQEQPTTSKTVKKAITGIRISYSTISGTSTAKISLQSSLQFSAIAYYQDNSSIDISTQVKWISSDPLVAKITDTAVARGTSEGAIIITAQYDGIDSNSVELTITDAVVTNIQIRPLSEDAGMLPKGVVQPMVATVTFSDRTQQELVTGVTWATNDASIATVTSTGVVKGINSGVATITAQFNGVNSNTVAVDVTDAVVTKLQISPKAGDLNNLPVGFTQPMVVTGIFSDDTQREWLSDVVWSIDNTSVATITPSGTVKGMSEGSTTISAQYDGIKSVPSVVTVTDITLADIIITASLEGVTNLVKGNDLQLVLTGIFSDDVRRVISDDVRWLSDNKSVASINESGSIHGIEIGQSTISAEFDNFKTHFIVDIDDAPVTFNTRILSPLDSYNGSSIETIQNGGIVAENNDVSLIYKGDHIEVSVISLIKGIQAEDVGNKFMLQKDEKNNIIGFAGYTNVYRTSEEHLYDDSRYTTFFSGYSMPNEPQVNGVYSGEIFYTRVAEDDNPRTGTISITLDEKNPSCLMNGLTELKCSSDASYDGNALVAKVLYSKDNAWHGNLYAHFYGENGEFATGYIYEESTNKVDVFLLSRK